jgi:hypothetical protein
VTTTDEKPTQIPPGDSGGGPFKGRIGALLVNPVLIVAIVLSIVWLPPISLGKRLFERGYVSLGQGIWSVTDPDGTQFTVLPEGLSIRLCGQCAGWPRPGRSR